MLLRIGPNQDSMLIDKKKEAHRGTLSRQNELYDLGKIKMPLSRDFYQASCEVGGLWSKTPGVQVAAA